MDYQEEYLFGLHNEKIEIALPNNACNSSFVQEESKKILDNKKVAKFTEFFQAFDNDSDGKISSRNISLTCNILLFKDIALPQEIMEIYAPLLLEMEDIEQSLNLDEFIESSNRLYNSLSNKEKDILLRYKKLQKENGKEDKKFCVRQLKIISLAKNKQKIKRNCRKGKKCKFKNC